MVQETKGTGAWCENVLELSLVGVSGLQPCRVRSWYAGVAGSGRKPCAQKRGSNDEREG